MQATTGELSLGIGRKRPDEQEEVESRTSGEPAVNRDFRTGEEPRSRNVGGEHIRDDTQEENLPPYIPPPRPAIVKDENVPVRFAARPSGRLGLTAQATATSTRLSGDTL